MELRQPLLSAELPETGERFEGGSCHQPRRGQPSRYASARWA